MDRAERIQDPVIALQAALLGAQAGIWTAMPGILLSFDAVKMTAVVQVAIQARIRTPGQEGVVRWEKIAPLVDCPVVFPAGGGFTLTFPLAAGDEVLVMFASRCIDAWWQSGGDRNIQMDLRMHDLSDGFVLPAVRSLARPLASVSTTDVELRSDSGANKIAIKPSGEVALTSALKVSITAPVVTVDASTSITLTAPNIGLNGDVDAAGGSFKHKGKSVGNTHKHSGVTTGASNSGNPI